MTREQMNLELMRIWSQSRKTVIFITHSIAEPSFCRSRDRDDGTSRHHRRGTDIDLPRPRDISVINTDRFGRYAAHLRTLLDARGGMF